MNAWTDFEGRLRRRWARAHMWRLAAALALVLLVTAPREGIAIGPPQAVRTVNAKMGVHTRLTDEVEPWKIRATLRLVHDMGAPWVVEFFPWPYFEPARGVYDWTQADLIVNLAREQGIQVIARLGAVPDWARPRPEDQVTNWNYLTEDHFADYAAYVRAFVTHFKGRVHYIIVLNEPNLTREWGFRPVDPEGYVRVLAQAYAAVKGADPSVQVLAGALAPTLEPEGSPWGLNDLVFLDRLYRAGFARYYDILAVHSYGLASAPEDTPAPGALNFRRVELAREVMLRYGDGAKPVMITESGWNDQPRWTFGVRPAERIQYTLAAYRMVQQRWPWAQVLAMWVFKYPAPFHNYMDNFAFVSSDLVPRVIYAEVQRYSQGDSRDSGDSTSLEVPDFPRVP